MCQYEFTSEACFICKIVFCLKLFSYPMRLFLTITTKVTLNVKAKYFFLDETPLPDKRKKYFFLQRAYLIISLCDY